MPRISCVWAGALVALSPLQVTAQIEISSQPFLSIGTVEGSELGSVTGAVIGPDGDLFILDAQAKSVLRFNHSGALTDSIGRAGEGPGEFVQPISVAIVGDTLFVTDSGSRRISLFLTNGELVEEISARTPFVIGEAERFADGSWLVRRQPRYPGNDHGLKRDTVSYFRLDHDFEEPELVLRTPGTLGMRYELEGREYIRKVAFSPEIWAAAWGKCGYVMVTDQPRITVVTSGGANVRTYELDGLPSPGPVTRADRLTYVDWVAGNAPPGYTVDEAEKVRMMRTIPFAEARPVSGDILTDPLGGAWVTGLGVGLASDVAVVVSPDFMGETRVSLPQQMKVLGVGRDYLIGLTATAIGEPLVVAYRVHRRGTVAAPMPACSL